MSAMPSRSISLPPGGLATEKTIDLMARAAMGSHGAHSPRIRRLALDIVRNARVPEKDKRGEVDAIHQWVMGHLRYVNDPFGLEFITKPETLAFQEQDGDCDDHAVLEVALLSALGMRTRFVTVAPVPGPMSHVYLQVFLTNTDGTTGEQSAYWLDLDPIVKNKPAGWAVPNPAAIKIYPVNTPAGIGLASTGSLLTTLTGLAGLLFKIGR